MESNLTNLNQKQMEMLQYMYYAWTIIKTTFRFIAPHLWDKIPEYLRSAEFVNSIK